MAKFVLFQMWLYMISLVFFVCIHNTVCYISVSKNRTYEENINTCVQGTYHKQEPGPEPQLHGTCEPWQGRACCESETTEDMHYSDVWHGFDWNHCGNISRGCWTWMMKDLCFYECSPNTGPWLVYEDKTFRDERYIDIPLCASECDAWWEECRYDYTCSDDWNTGWDWSTGTNKCPEDKVCRTFDEYFGSARNMCENLFGSWNYTPDDEYCFKLSFDGPENPNDEVCKHYAKELEEINSATTVKESCLSILVILFTLAANSL
ncbi:folate receptor beta-like [Glandiceps talaboti]